MRLAYEAAGLAPADVPLVECHATGSPLADLIEVRALKRLFTPGLRLGSIRSNLGHPITASGLASLIKVRRDPEAVHDTPIASPLAEHDGPQAPPAPQRSFDRADEPGNARR